MCQKLRDTQLSSVTDKGIELFSSVTWYSMKT